MSDEIAIDTKGKRSWPKELKRQIVAESDAEGVTVCEVARRYDIDPAQLYQWRKLFRNEATAGAEFLPIELAADQVDPDDDGSDGARGIVGRAEIMFPNGRRLLVAAGLDRRLLDDLVGATANAS